MLMGVLGIFLVLTGVGVCIFGYVQMGFTDDELKKRLKNAKDLRSKYNYPALHSLTPSKEKIKELENEIKEIETEIESKNKSRRMRGIAIIAVGLAVGLFGYFTYSGTASKSVSSGKDSFGNTANYASQIAQTIVEDELKAPSTAKFSGIKTSLKDDTWTVSGNVDAQNSFGATIRNSFIVVFKFGSQTSYKVISCSIN